MLILKKKKYMNVYFITIHQGTRKEQIKLKSQKEENNTNQNRKN